METAQEQQPQQLPSVIHIRGVLLDKNGEIWKVQTLSGNLFTREEVIFMIENGIFGFNTLSYHGQTHLPESDIKVIERDLADGRKTKYISTSADSVKGNNLLKLPKAIL